MLNDIYRAKLNVVRLLHREEKDQSLHRAHGVRSCEPDTAAEDSPVVNDFGHPRWMLYVRSSVHQFNALEFVYESLSSGRQCMAFGLRDPNFPDTRERFPGSGFAT